MLANPENFLIRMKGAAHKPTTFLDKPMKVEMGLTTKRQWYLFFKPVFCWIGIHEWVKVKYRKKDRTLIVWEECLICRKVKED